jgi:hypothetical protein
MQRETWIVLACGALAVVLAVLVMLGVCKRLHSPSDLAIRGGCICPVVLVPAGTYSGSVYGIEGTVTVSKSIFVESMRPGQYANGVASLRIKNYDITCPDVGMRLVDGTGNVAFSDPSTLSCLNDNDEVRALSISKLEGVYRPADNSIVATITCKMGPIALVLRPQATQASSEQRVY